MKKLSLLLATVCASICAFAACGGENTVVENKIQLHKHNGETIDCTPAIYQTYLSLTDENGNYYFNDDGYVTVSDNYVAIGLLYKGLMHCYGTGDGKLSSAIKNYLRTDVGLTDEDFQAIENIMLT